MEKKTEGRTPEEGNLDRNPFSFLLFRYWQAKAEGTLTLTWKDGGLSLPWLSGRPCCTVNFFSRNDIRKTLQEITSPSKKREKADSDPYKKADREFLQDVIQESSLPAADVWKRIENTAIDKLRILFDRDQGAYHFQFKDKPDPADVLFFLDVPSILMTGVEGMTNEKMLYSHLPVETEFVCSLQVPFPNFLCLKSHQEYILRLIEKHHVMSEVFLWSPLDKNDTLRTLFLLKSAGVLTFSQNRETKSIPEVISPAVIHELVGRLNSHLVLICKFMSKEIGPFSLNVLEKNIHGIQKHLSPLFRDIKLLPDGTIDTQSILKTQYTPSGRDTLQNFRRDLNEILTAEILAAKKILGDEKESALIRQLRTL